MQLLGFFLAACVALAIAKAAITIFVLLFLVALIWGLCFHPREMFGFLAYCAIFGFIKAQPMLALLIIGAAIVSKICDKPP